MSTDPIMLTGNVMYRVAEAIDETGAARGESVVMTFHGQMLVDGERVPGSRISAAIPTEVFETLVTNLTSWGTAEGLIDQGPRAGCPSDLILRDTDRGRAGVTLGWSVLHCTRQYRHAGPHVAGYGPTRAWSDAQAKDAADRFAGEARHVGYAL